jgi:hypothetical protein
LALLSIVVLGACVSPITPMKPPETAGPVPQGRGVRVGFVSGTSPADAVEGAARIFFSPTKKPPPDRPLMRRLKKAGAYNCRVRTGLFLFYFVGCPLYNHFKTSHLLIIRLVYSATTTCWSRAHFYL